MKIALVEDDPEIVGVVSVAFETAWPGSQVVVAPDGVKGLELVRAENPDILILDLALPEGETYGFEVCKQIRTFSEMPIIILTARTSEVDVVRGLAVGASDYMPKPFKPMELLARSWAVLRRTQMRPLGTENRPFVSKDLSVDYNSREVVVQGQPVKLTPTEYKLLCFMIRNPQQLLTNRTLLEEVWGEGNQDSEALIKVHIQHLRKKLRDNPQSPKLIITERGRGYRFTRPG